MSKERVLLKLKHPNGLDKIYTENLPNKYHPYTGELVKKGDWMYKIVDKKAWDTLKVDHFREFELIDFPVGWKQYGKEEVIEVTEVKPNGEVKIIQPKGFNTKDYSVAKFRDTEFTLEQLQEFLKDERKSIVALAEKRIKEM